MKLTTAVLRAAAVDRAFPKPTSLKRALARMGFVQADPIRAPARAQDLILRHRVRDYHAGELEQRYPELDIEEDYLYAYGFLTRENWRLLHPRAPGGLSAFEQRVLGIVTARGEVHPRELEVDLGRDTEVNAWGGSSKATTRALQHLHYRGLLRIARRDAGIRVYEPTPPVREHVSTPERLRRVAMLACEILAPIPIRSLAETLRLTTRYALRGTAPPKTLVAELQASGELETGETEGTKYVWPAGALRRRSAGDVVRIVSPFDPLVWDRRRFQLFWNWAYRFEAYTPKAKRLRGYYAMPVFWRDLAVGWANVTTRGEGVAFEFGFVNGRPADAGFESALEEEVERMRRFLGFRPKEPAHAPREARSSASRRTGTASD